MVLERRKTVNVRRSRVHSDDVQVGRSRSESLEDADLLARVGRGDEVAIEALYQRYGGGCYALARRLLNDTGLAEDVVQQVFLALWQGHSYDPARGAVSTWLLSVTHHKAVDALRRESRRRTMSSSDEAMAQLAATSPTPDDEAWRLLRAERTRAALRSLRAEHREVLLLAYYGGCSQREIAEMTGLPLGTVKSRTLAAMNRLREELKSVDDTATDESRRRP
jgi:RNA polymerase sigma factor (sigma-70 family)